VTQKPTLLEAYYKGLPERAPDYPSHLATGDPLLSRLQQYNTNTGVAGRDTSCSNATCIEDGL